MSFLKKLYTEPQLERELHCGSARIRSLCEELEIDPVGVNQNNKNVYSQAQMLQMREAMTRQKTKGNETRFTFKVNLDIPACGLAVQYLAARGKKVGRYICDAVVWYEKSRQENPEKVEEYLRTLRTAKENERAGTWDTQVIPSVGLLAEESGGNASGSGGSGPRSKQEPGPEKLTEVPQSKKETAAPHKKKKKDEPDYDMEVADVDLDSIRDVLSMFGTLK